MITQAPTKQQSIGRQFIKSKKCKATQVSHHRGTNIENTFKKQHNKSSCLKDEKQKRYKTIEPEIIQQLDSKRLGDEVLTSPCKDPFKFRRYHSIEEEENVSQKPSRSLKELKYISKKGRILINLNSSRSNNFLSFKVGSHSGQGKNSGRKLASASVDLQPSSNYETAEPISSKEEQNSASKPSKKQKKQSSRRFLTEISTTTGSLFKVTSKGLSSLKSPPIGIKFKTKQESGPDQYYNNLKGQFGSGNAAIFDKYLSTRKKLQQLQDMDRNMNNKAEILEQKKEKYSKIGSTQYLEENLGEISSILEANESSFLSNSTNRSFMKQLVDTREILNQKFKKQKPLKRQEKDSNKKPTRLILQNSENCVANAIEGSFEIKNEFKSKKNLLRSIDKIKKAFPTGFFQGL